MVAKKEVITHILTRDEHNLVLAALAGFVEHDAAIIEHIKAHSKELRNKKVAARAIKGFKQRQTNSSKLQVKLIQTWVRGR